MKQTLTATIYLTSKWLGLIRPLVAGFDSPLTRPAGNFELAAYKGLLIKDSYWRWPERNLAGNAIDFSVQGSPTVEKRNGCKTDGQEGDLLPLGFLRPIH